MARNFSINKRILLVGIVCFLIISSFYPNYNSIDTEYKDEVFEDKIDSGFSPEQEWRIIYGEDIESVLNYKEEIINES